MVRAETLSHQSLGGKARKMPRSLRICRSQQSLVVMVARALYSDSVEDCDTVSCFLAL